MKTNDHQSKLIKETDEFIESLNLTPEKIREDLEKMRNIEGFPIGDVEDILELSDPPYYTSYPNPYIKDFIEYYGTPYDEKSDDYDVEPFIEDESYGRTDSVYNIHFYHTKVPPQAISRYINHYTNKNDIILDFFAGSGMTGVASLRLGRFPILIDLSPFAGFIEYNNLKKLNLDKFKNFAHEIYNSVFKEYGYLYNIDDENNVQRNFAVWSEVQTCPFCSNDYLYFDAESPKKNIIICPKCKVELNINKLKCKLGDNNKGIFKPVEIHFIEGNKRKSIKINKYEKEILEKIEKIQIPYWFPETKLFDGYNTSQPIRSHGFDEIKNFFTKRNMLTLSAFCNEIKNYDIDNSYKKKLIYAITGAMIRLTNLNRYMPSHNRHVGPLSGTLYIPKLFAEINPFKNIKEKINSILKAKYDYKPNNFLVSTQSATVMSNIKENIIDYIFIDPPFGENLMYSEINFIFESWLKIFTFNKDEAIINPKQDKTEHDYFNLIYKCFIEANRILKPDRWITIEFHNSKASIWRIIQESLVKAGFIIAQVLTLDKQKGTTKQLSYAGTVKNDLIINAYKPNKEFSETFLRKSGINMEYEFIKMHLNKLPIDQNTERQTRELYSKLLAQYIQNGFEVKWDASELYSLLNEKFVEKDGYWFNENQISNYEKNMKLKDKMSSDDLKEIWISDEKTAITWIGQFLKNPKTYAEIHEKFLKTISTSEDKIPELKTILDENFTTEDGKYKLLSNMEKKEKEEIRDKRLMREFNKLLEEAQKSKKKIKEVRKEALLHGLMKLYKEKDVDMIKLIGNRVDRKIIDSDDDISAIVDWALYK
ncbi:MAG: site-specific DNA-methyltransferase [Methanobrevibacter sp.]|nr:site-specific DNA-methyltransferase [Methanobrevibacter sp.]